MDHLEVAVVRVLTLPSEQGFVGVCHGAEFDLALLSAERGFGVILNQGPAQTEFSVGNLSDFDCRRGPVEILDYRGISDLTRSLYLFKVLRAEFREQKRSDLRPQQVCGFLEHCRLYIHTRSRDFGFLHKLIMAQF